MPQGLQVFNADGTVKIDTSTLLGRIFGSIQVAAGQASGSVSNEQFSQGQPFMVGLLGLGAFNGSVLSGPAFSQVSYSKSGNTLNWSRSSNVDETNLPAGILYYGVL